MNQTQAVNALAALAQHMRLEIFRCLVQAGPDGLAAGVISQTLNLPNSTLSFHLKELSHAGLIQARQDGRFIYYRASYDHMNALLAYLTENCCAGTTACCEASYCHPTQENP